MARRVRLHEGARRTGLVEQHGPDASAPVPLSIVRPSIIESALAEPHPGWIRGFRMAEPIIISYARGLLREFPGVVEGVVDVIPVDLVVATILAVAAKGPEERPAVYHVASGVRNPLEYGQLAGPGPGLLRSPSRSTTNGASQSRCPSGHSPAAAASSASFGRRSG